MRWREVLMADPSPEAREAIEEARYALADNQAISPLVERVGRQLREHSAANHFIDLVEQTIKRAAAAR